DVRLPHRPSCFHWLLSVKCRYWLYVRHHWCRIWHQQSSAEDQSVPSRVRAYNLTAQPLGNSRQQPLTVPHEFFHGSVRVGHIPLIQLNVDKYVPCRTTFPIKQYLSDENQLTDQSPLHRVQLRRAHWPWLLYAVSQKTLHHRRPGH